MAINKISIAINGSMLDDHPTGVGIYSINLINYFSLLYKAEHLKMLTVFAPANSSLNKNISTIKIPSVVKSSKYGKLAAVSRFLWNTFIYPYQVRNFDLLISPTTHGSLFATNQIIAIHDLISLRFKNISIHQRFYYKNLLPLLVSKAKLIITVSETSKRDIAELLQCPANKIKVVYNGYDNLKYFFNGLKGEQIFKAYSVKNYLLAVGPTYPHKNFETLIDAYSKLDESARASHPLILAGGKRKYVGSLKKYISATTSGANIHFLGYVPDELMPSLYSEAIALVFPSLYEGFGIPLLEAMASGCPVVTSHASSMPEVCGEAALYFDPLDTAALSAKMQQLINDKELQAQLREKGLQQAKKFSWQKSAKTLQTIIENIESQN